VGALLTASSTLWTRLIFQSVDLRKHSVLGSRALMTWLSYLSAFHAQSSSTPRARQSLLVVRELELARRYEGRTRWNRAVERLWCAELFISQLVGSEGLLIEYLFRNRMVKNVLATSCGHSFRVFDGSGEEMADALVAPTFLTLAAWSTEAVFLYRVGTYEAYNFPVFGRTRWQ
jgi:hypothetical protein